MAMRVFSGVLKGEKRQLFIKHKELWGTGKKQLCCVFWRNSEKKGGKGGEILT